MTIYMYRGNCTVQLVIFLSCLLCFFVFLLCVECKFVGVYMATTRNPAQTSVSMEWL